MGKGPLADPRLRAIEAKLNSAEFDEAQRLLAALRHEPGTEAASAYFSTRLLYQRGRLDNAGVAQRLREVLSSRPGEFPQAENMLTAAELGVLESSPEGFLRSTQPPFPKKSSDGGETRPNSRPGQGVAAAGIPRAPLMPRFSSPTIRAGESSFEASDLEELTSEHHPTDGVRARRSPSVLPGIEFELEMTPQRVAIPSSLPPIPDLTSSAPTEPPPQADQRHTAPVTRSAAPDAIADPSLEEIALALDAGDAHHALDLLARKTPPHDPEYTLLSIRARVALGDHARARRELEPLLRVGGLPASLRTVAARLLLDLGSPEAALDQAGAALEANPDDVAARITFAWALVRAMRRSGDLSRAHEVETLLATTPVRSGPHTALALALRASLLAARGPALRALSLAQAALRQDPRQADAFAAVALSSIRLGMHAEAEQALTELRALNPEEASALTRSLTQSTVPPPYAKPHSPSAPPLESIWGKPEAALVRGDPGPALLALDRACGALRAEVAREGDAAWSTLGRAAASLFTEQAVFRHFAPYDSSVFSMQRLAAAIDVLLGERSHASEPLVMVCGAYIGECIRQAYGGDWESPTLDPAQATIHAAGLSVDPCQLVRRRLGRGEALRLPQPRRLHPGADPFGNSSPIAQSPPSPWDPEPWPNPARLADVARALPESVVGLHCLRACGEALDHTQDSLERIDRFLDLLAPPDAPLDGSAGWVRRAALLAGGYLGQVLVVDRGARMHPVEQVDDFHAYRYDLPNGTACYPVERVHERLLGRSVNSLADYVADFEVPPSGAAR
jgi:tetratricopeptide (TPR) repeat protein